MIAGFPDREQAKLAALDRAVLALRAGRAPDALRDLRGLESDAAMSSYLGPIRMARGVALAGAGQASEAEVEFRGALAAGEDAAGHLGLGRLAFERRQWAEAAREFAAARDAGGGPAAAVAEYGLAATAYAQGDRAEFRRLATPLLAAPRSRPPPRICSLVWSVRPERTRTGGRPARMRSSWWRPIPITASRR